MVFQVSGVSIEEAPAGVVTLRRQCGPPQEVPKEKYLDEVRPRERESRISVREASTGPWRLNITGSSPERMSLSASRPRENEVTIDGLLAVLEPEIDALDKRVIWRASDSELSARR